MPATRQPTQAPESFQDLHFPLCGLDISTGFDSQPTRPMSNGQYARTTPVGVNVVAYEPSTNRARGGSRPGLVQYVPQQVNGFNSVQDLKFVVNTSGMVNLGTGIDPKTGLPLPGGGFSTGNPSTNTANRALQLVAVSNGVAAVAYQGSWRTVGGLTLSTAAAVIRSAVNTGKIYYADGVTAAYYDPAKNQMVAWTASQGTFNVDSAGNLHRLIATWRGRTLLAGYPANPGEIFATAVGDPSNFNLAPQSFTPTQAWALSATPLGAVPDPVTCLIPYNDDILVIGTDHTLWQLSGDPLAGGNLFRISDAMGIAWGEPWCVAPDGTIYFVSNLCAVYSMTPGGLPQRISQSITPLLLPINVDNVVIRLMWNDYLQGLHVFYTTFAGATASDIHYFWEQRSGGWFQVSYGNANLNPMCCINFEGNTPQDRVPLIGSWDGYVRAVSNNASSDDGTLLASKVMLGPFLTKDLDEIMVKDLQAVLGALSGKVTWGVYQGATAELALSSQPVATGTWTAGRNALSFVRRSNYATWVQISSTVPWAMESVRARIMSLGKVRRRGVGL